jgi:aldose 1-epimerase
MSDLARRDVLKAAAAAGIGGVAVSALSSGTADAATPSHRKSHGHLFIKKDSFGKTSSGEPVDRYSFGDKKHLWIQMLTFGALIQTIYVPDRWGRLANVELGLKTIEEYETESPYFGATIGRYANRIAKGQFTLDGVTYQVPPNDGNNALHGGPVGWDKHVWSAKVIDEHDRVGVAFSLVSPNGDQGFPGTVKATVTYTIDRHATLTIDYHATTDKATVINLTNHAYFNMAGEASGDVYDQIAVINADRYTPIDAESIPLGPLVTVAGTPFDFRKPHTFGERIREGVEQILNGHGYDHNWVLNKHGKSKKPSFTAKVTDPKSGRFVECWTTEPGVQVYTGNFLDGSIVGISGTTYRQGDAFTLETQHFPNSPNEPSYPSTVLRPGQTFRSTTLYRFGAR